MHRGCVSGQVELLRKALPTAGKVAMEVLAKLMAAGDVLLQVAIVGGGLRAPFIRAAEDLLDGGDGRHGDAGARRRHEVDREMVRATAGRRRDEDGARDVEARAVVVVGGRREARKKRGRGR